MSTKYIVTNTFVVFLSFLDSELSNSFDLNRLFAFLSCTDDEKVCCRLKSQNR